MDASLDGWLTEGRFADRFRTELRGVTVGPSTSRSSARARRPTCWRWRPRRSHLHERPLRPGDEVITPAIGFPTTVNPLYQNGLVPVYVDVEPDTFNPSLEAIADAVGAAHARGGGRALPRQPL